MSDRYEVHTESDARGNWIATLCIGENHRSMFNKYCLGLAREYCVRNGIGLISIFEDISDDCLRISRGKKLNWQKLLIPEFLRTRISGINNLCYIDSDILVNPFSQDVFSVADEEKFAVVSQTHNVPFDDYECRKIISFYRNRYYSQSYPLDSAIFMSTEDVYRHHGFEVFSDYCCSGMFVCNVNRYAKPLKRLFEDVANDTTSLTDGGDEPYFNMAIRVKCNEFELQNLPYKYQAIWSWEMASRYRSLFAEGLTPTQKTREAITDCLLSVSFLHFAGGWPDSWLYRDERLTENVLSVENEEFSEYLRIKPTGRPVGRVVFNSKTDNSGI